VQAASQSISIGETRDYEFKAGEAGSYVFEVRSAHGGALYSSMVLESRF
jgi:hypothetical protein